MQHSLGMLVALSGLAAGGCAHQVFSPPAGLPNLESPAVVGAGKNAVAADFMAAHLGLDAGDVFGGALKVRHGFSDALELQGALAGFAIDEDAKEDTFPWTFSGRVGLKGSFVADFPHLAWKAGLGIGGSAGGLFSAADLGLIGGYENPYATPWVSVSGIASVPLTSETVDITPVDEETPRLDHPVTTLGVQVALGVSVAVGASPVELHLSLHQTWLWDIHGVDETVAGFALGVETPF